jgi:arginase
MARRPDVTIEVADHRIIVPTFLDRPVPRLEEVARLEDTLIPAKFAEGGQVARLVPVHRALAKEVERTLNSGKRPVTIMGDCCLAIPVHAGIRRAGLEPTLIWLDAHGDFNTWETTPSGFLGGMPLAMMVGRGDLSLCEAVGLSPFPEQRVILADARDLDPGERDLLASSRVQHVGDIAALQHMKLPGGPVYVHFDTDIISSQDAPAFHYPVSNGPNAEIVSDILSRLARDCEIIATSMTCWAPELDRNGETKVKCIAAHDALLDYSIG